MVGSKKKVRKAMDDVRKGEEDGDEDMLKLSEEKLESLEFERKAANEESNYAFNVRVVRGAKEFDKLIDTSEDNKKTRMTQQAFLLRSAIRMYAGFFSAM